MAKDLFKDVARQIIELFRGPIGPFHSGLKGPILGGHKVFHYGWMSPFVGFHSVLMMVLEIYKMLIEFVAMPPAAQEFVFFAH